MGFGKRLARLMKDSGISELILADTCGVSQRTVQNWLGGAFMPSSEKLPIIVKALNATYDDLLGPPMRVKR